MMEHDDTARLRNDHLHRLEAATADLPLEVREDLLVEVRSHLDEVADRARTEADVRQALDRLGPREAVAAEARSGSITTTATAPVAFAMAPWYGIPVVILVTVAPIVVAGVLLGRADKRR